MDVLSENGVWVQGKDGSFAPPMNGFAESGTINAAGWDEASGQILVDGHDWSRFQAVFAAAPDGILTSILEWRDLQPRGLPAWIDIDGDGDTDIWRGWTLVQAPELQVTLHFQRRETASLQSTFVTADFELPQGLSMPSWGPDRLWPHDHDGDGDLDVLVSVRNRDRQRLVLLYAQEPQGWEERLVETFDAGYELDAAWMDLAGDGHPDIVLIPSSGFTADWRGEVSLIYENRGPSIFGPHQGYRKIETTVKVPLLTPGFVDWDGDGDSDYTRVFAGRAEWHENRLGTGRPAEVALPRGLMADIEQNRVRLRWMPALNQKLKPLEGATYNVWVRKTDGEIFEISPLAQGDGWRLFPGPGNAGTATARDLALESSGTYRWAVQTIDSAYRGSAFVEAALTLTLSDAVPLAETTSAASLDSWSADLSGIVNPNGAETTVWFLWGVGNAFSRESAPFVIPAGGAPVEVRQTVTGLVPSVEHRFRIVAENTAGRTSADPVSLTTSFLARTGDAVPGSNGLIAPAIATGDLDADGLSDLLIGGERYRQAADGRLVLEGRWLTEEVAPQWIHLADVNRDGRPDIAATNALSGAINEGIRLFLFDGASYQKHLLPETAPLAPTLWFDHDQDGDLDVLVSEMAAGRMNVLGNHQLRLIRNDGDGGWMPEALDFPVIPGKICRVFAEDLDGDADLDLVVSYQTQTDPGTEVLRNDGVGNLRWYVPWHTLDDFVSAVADIDSDGNLDLAAVNSLWMNGGDGTLTHQSFEGMTSQAWADVDHDGDLDALVYQRPQSAVLLQTALGVFDRMPSGLPDLGATDGVLQWVDLGGDRNPELLTPVGVFRQERAGAETPPSPPQGLLAEVDGMGVKLSWQAGEDVLTPPLRLTYSLEVIREPGGQRILTQPLAGNRLSVPGAGNAGHGLFHRLHGLAPGTYRWEERTVAGTASVSSPAEGQAFVITENTRPPAAAWTPSATRAELSFAGRIDTGNLETHYYFDYGPDADYGRSTPVQILAPTPEPVPVRLQVPDLVPGQTVHYRIVVENALGSFESEDQTVHLTSFEHVEPSFLAWHSDAVLVGDVNQDGYPDVHWLNGEAQTWWLHQGSSQSLNWETHRGIDIRFPTELSPASAALGDANGDGILDLAIGGFLQGMGARTQVFPLPATLPNVTPLEAAYTLAGLGDLQWQDYDNDGDLDLLTSAPRLWRNDGTRISQVSLPGNLTIGAACAWGDLDQDGDADFLVAGRQEFQAPNLVYLFVNERTAFSLRELPLPPTHLTRLQLADDDADGDLDILVHGHMDSMPATYLFRQKELAAFVGHSGSLPDITIETAPVWGDMDGDGDWDMIVIEGTFGRLFRQDDGVYATLLDEFEMNLLPARVQGAFVDLDRDGDRDLLMGGHRYRNRQVDELIIEPRPPEPPHTLTVGQEPGAIRLHWKAPARSGGYSYNVRAGLTPGRSELVSSMSLADGRRQLFTLGNAGALTEMRLRLSADVETIYWSVQSVDPALNSSAFAEEQLAVRRRGELWQIHSIEKVGSELMIRFPSNLESSYEIQYSETLAPVDWIRLTEVPGKHPETTVALTVPASRRGFIRVVASSRP